MYHSLFCDHRSNETVNTMQAYARSYVFALFFHTANAPPSTEKRSISDRANDLAAHVGRTLIAKPISLASSKGGLK